MTNPTYSWTGPRIPFDTDYEDKFYAEEGGLAEARYVFVGQNQLEERWAQWKNSGNLQTTFSIGELGFGTGLNFLATWELWRKLKMKEKGFRLHYWSIDRYPLPPSVIQEALSVWPEIRSLSDRLLEIYPPYSSQSSHRMIFEDEGITLTIWAHDALAALQDLRGPFFDAWYLDGFAPRRNPAMWQLDLMERLAELSKENATFATYTSAGWVRRNLEAVGFKVEKFRGFERKQEMLRGVKTTPTPKSPATMARPKTIAVIGAGLAGAFVAARLAARGFEVTVIDRGAGPASQASGIRALVAMPTLTAEPSVTTELNLAALRFWRHFLAQGDRGEHLRITGALRIPRDDNEAERFLRSLEWAEAPEDFIRWVSAAEASRIAGSRVLGDAVYYPFAGSIDSAQICRALIHSSPIKGLWNSEVLELERQNGTWNLKVQGAQQEISSLSVDLVVIANSHDALRLSPTQDLPLSKNRGQLCLLKPSSSSMELKCIVASEKYFLPTHEGMHVLGSSYDRENFSLEIRDNENERMQELMKRKLPDIFQNSLEVVSSQVSFRASTPNKLPIVGAMENLEGLYTLVGLGSRGSLLAPLLGESLASEIAHESSPLKSTWDEAMRSYLRAPASTD